MLSLLFALSQPVNPSLIAGFGPTPIVTDQVCTAGDYKYSFKAANHGRWVLTNGGLKSALPASQQANATGLGIGANLPDTRDRAIVGVSGTKPLNSTGGAATVAIAQANLPVINLIGGSHGHGISDPGHAHSVPQANNGTFNSNGAAGAPVGFGNSFGTSANTTGISVSASGNLSIPLGGSGTALSVQNSYLALSGFICL
jgi:hypothetical protein